MALNFRSLRWILTLLTTCSLLVACGGGGNSGAMYFTVGGAVSGLTATGLTLASGGDAVAVAAGANSFTLPNPFVSGAGYSVTVTAQPTGLTCSVSNGSGTVSSANITNVQVACATNTFSLGGTVSALTVSGLILADGNDTVSIAAGVTTFTFPAKVASGAQYAVSVQAQAHGLTCEVSNGTGTMGAAAVTNVRVVCGEWTWEGGSNGVNAVGVYGTLGTPASGNAPGARLDAARWTDAGGNLWLFGGSGYGSTAGTQGLLNDLWKFNPATGQWTWVSGSQSVNAAGVYGTQGSATAGAVPGARSGAATWVDGSGNLWLFGGNGYSATNAGDLSDLWQFSPASGLWTWLGGSNSSADALEPCAVSSVPCQRNGSSSWVDSSGQFWLFGGVTQVTLNEIYRNDLWKYDSATNQWTLMSGSANSDVSASYGTRGSAAVGNIPGARAQSASWTDHDGNLWLFGGHGDNPALPSDVLSGLLNDLWEFNISTGEWVWVSGAQILGAGSSYESLGGNGTNTPGASGDDGFAMDSDGNFWLYDGDDLWQYQPNVSEWFWMSGNPPTQSFGAYGTYGTEGVAAPNNVPGTRGGGSLWIEAAGRAWLFGGNGNATSTAGTGTLNDLWEFVP